MIKLKPLEAEDLQYVVGLRNKYKKYLRQWKLINNKEQIKWHDNLKDEHVFYSIHEACYLIGACGFTYIDWQSRKAELSFITKDYVYKADEVVKEMLRVAFEEWNLHKVWVEIYDFDKQKRKVLESLGFINSAVLFENYFYKGWHDSLIYIYLNKHWIFA